MIKISGSRSVASMQQNNFEKNSIANEETAVNAMSSLIGLLIIWAILIVFGLTMLYSASYGIAGAKYFRNQIIWIVVGMIAASGVIVVGFKSLVKISSIIMVLCFIALLAAAFLYEPVKGASRWIKVALPGLGLVSIQPSEFAKVAVAIFVAKYCSDNFRTFSLLKNKNGLLPLALGVAAIMIGVMSGSDLGTTSLIGMIAFSTMIVAGLNLRYIFIPTFGAGIIAILIYFFDPMRLARFTSFLNPESVKSKTGYQLWHSLLSLGSGNWFGVGFMEGRMKQRYLPEAHNDFILAVVGEELGFITIIFVFILYILFCYYGFKISINSNSRLGMLLGFAVTIWVGIQSAINLAVVSGAMPTKGMPAPFISYGGSSMITLLIGVGILVSIALESSYPNYNIRIKFLTLKKLSFLPWFRKYREKI